MGNRQPLLIEGMHGLGDNVHQRAILRQLIEPGRDIWLTTPWPCVYHDMPDLKLVRPRYEGLRTQFKNMEREAARYTREPPAPHAFPMRIWYDKAGIDAVGSILGAMLLRASCDPTIGDFRYRDVPQAWIDEARRFVKTDKPILVYRPLVVRDEWPGCAIRNPDFHAYAYLFELIRRRFYVVSIADLVPNKEWTVGREVDVDLKLHRGELHFPALVGLFAMASMVYTSPGFATVLAQAVSTPLVTVFGGRESGQTISLGARYSPTLAIDPIKPCMCMSTEHGCSENKAIDLVVARRKIIGFTDASLADHRDRTGHGGLERAPATVF